MHTQSSRRLFGTRVPLIAMTFAAAVLLLPRPASAHHGWGGYLDAEFEITGTVESSVSLAGPHATMTIRGTDGHVWNLVLAPPPRSQQAGLKDGMIPVGFKVTAHGHRHRDNDRFEVKTERLTWGDHVFNVYRTAPDARPFQTTRMLDFTALATMLKLLQASALGHFMRESGAWTYAIVNLLHILGVASLFGSVLVLDLRLLGLGRRIPLAALADATVPVATAGFAVAATTGVGLLATKATEYIGNPFLAIKFPAIALGLINVLALRLSPAWQARAQRELSRREHRQLAVMGGLSLACWLTAITAGRMIAYW